MIIIGRLNHRVVFQQYAEVQNNYGEIVPTWQDVCTVWGSVNDLSGKEFFAAQQVNAKITTRIRIRYRAGIVPTMRAVCGDRVFNIIAVLDYEGKKRELQVMCEEVH